VLHSQQKQQHSSNNSCERSNNKFGIWSSGSETKKMPHSGNKNNKHKMRRPRTKLTNENWDCGKIKFKICNSSCTDNNKLPSSSKATNNTHRNKRRNGSRARNDIITYDY
jgi:hypothetical protein